MIKQSKTAEPPKMGQG